MSHGYSFEDLVALLHGHAPAKVAAVARHRRRVEHGYLSVGLKMRCGAVAGLVGIEGGVVSGVINLESSGVEAPDWRRRHEKQYHDA
jgi:hypothetical protein